MVAPEGTRALKLGLRMLSHAGGDAPHQHVRVVAVRGGRRQELRFTSDDDDVHYDRVELRGGVL